MPTYGCGPAPDFDRLPRGVTCLCGVHGSTRCSALFVRNQVGSGHQVRRVTRPMARAQDEWLTDLADQAEGSRRLAVISWMSVT
jgi:hypothetical protein